MYQEKINNYEQSAKKESDLGFDSERLSYIPKYFSSYIDKGKLPNFTLLVARNNEIAHLSSQGFSSIEDNKPIVFIPSSEIGSFIRNNKNKDKVQSTEFMSWILHDLGHLENIVDAGIDSGDSPGVNLSDVDSKYKKVRTYINKQLNQADEDFYCRGIIAGWLNKIGYTPTCLLRIWRLLYSGIA